MFLLLTIHYNLTIWSKIKQKFSSKFFCAQKVKRSYPKSIHIFHICRLKHNITHHDDRQQKRSSSYNLYVVGTLNSPIILSRIHTYDKIDVLCMSYVEVIRQVSKRRRCT